MDNLSIYIVFSLVCSFATVFTKYLPSIETNIRLHFVSATCFLYMVIIRARLLNRVATAIFSSVVSVTLRSKSYV
jgi:hypothetical protein